jgi:hypothetical protein
VWEQRLIFQHIDEEHSCLPEKQARLNLWFNFPQKAGLA